MKKRILIALFAGATVFGLALAFAASLGLTSGNLQAGDAAVVSCDPDGVVANYTVGYAGGYNVNSVVVTGIAAACNGRTVGVTLTNSSGNVVGSNTVTFSSASLPAGQMILTITPAPAASAVTDVHAVIYS